MTPLETYQSYLALKLHFGGKYDYFKYGGKTSATLSAFEKRKDKFKFVKLSQKLSDPQILDYYLANFIRGKEWIGDFDQKNWLEHKKVNQSLEYVYKNDIEKLLTISENFDILFKVGEGNHPKLVKAYLGKKISLETLVILEKVLEYRKQFDAKISETYVWPKVSLLIKKYEPFLDIDARAFRLKTLTLVKELTL
jgi:hypothetical protein|tara:strand:+ start:1480 stop:2064 length:585 start_codon:yes stop_codon:yes gene_type:complete